MQNSLLNMQNRASKREAFLAWVHHLWKLLSQPMQPSAASSLYSWQLFPFHPLLFLLNERKMKELALKLYQLNQRYFAFVSFCLFVCLFFNTCWLTLVICYSGLTFTCLFVRVLFHVFWTVLRIFFLSTSVCDVSACHTSFIQEVLC